MDYKKIKSYADACKVLGIEPLADEAFNAFPKAEREDVKAYHQLSVITKAINNGWEPNWSDRSQEKYEPFVYTDSAGLAYAYTHRTPSYTDTNIGSRLCFPDYERATYAVDTFGDLYKAYFRPGKWENQEPAEEAAEKEQEQPAADGGDGIIREEDDMSDAPDFLKKVVAVCKEQIEPLCEGENKGIILIAVEDGVEDKDGKKAFGTTFAVHGTPAPLAKGLNRFMSNERTQPIVEKAYRYAKLDCIVDKVKDFINDITNL